MLDIYLNNWHKPLSRAKLEAKEAGRISSDAELCELVNAEMEERGWPQIGRAALNHWINGVRPPNIRQLIVLCSVLGISPVEVFETGSVFARNRHIDKDLEEAASILNGTDAVGKKLALGGMRAALIGHVPKKGKQK